MVDRGTGLENPLGGSPSLGSLRAPFLRPEGANRAASVASQPSRRNAPHGARDRAFRLFARPRSTRREPPAGRSEPIHRIHSIVSRKTCKEPVDLGIQSARVTAVPRSRFWQSGIASVPAAAPRATEKRQSREARAEYPEARRVRNGKLVGAAATGRFLGTLGPSGRRVQPRVRPRIDPKVSGAYLFARRPGQDRAACRSRGIGRPARPGLHRR